MNIENLISPSFLYGTAWKEEDTERCVTNALSAGFRGIDTANQRKHYFEKGVGDALLKAYAQDKITRSRLFLQTKFTLRRGQDNRLPYDPEAPLGEQVQQSFSSSLEHLQTDYLDSYVLHGPSSSEGIIEDDWEVWRAMERLHAEGQTRNLGVSNVSTAQLKELYQGASVKPAFVQIRTYASRGWENETRAFCAANNIIFQGFSLLTANREIFQNRKFLAIQERLGCTPSQLVFQFALKVGMLPITGTKDPTHMREDLACSKLPLSSDDISAIESLFS